LLQAQTQILAEAIASSSLVQVTTLGEYDHILSVLTELNWLTVKQCASFKIVTLALNVKRENQSSYLHNPLCFMRHLIVCVRLLKIYTCRPKQNCYQTCRANSWHGTVCLVQFENCNSLCTFESQLKCTFLNKLYKTVQISNMVVTPLANSFVLRTARYI